MSTHTHARSTPPLCPSWFGIPTPAVLGGAVCLAVVAGAPSAALADITVDSSISDKKVGGVVVGKTVEYCISADHEDDRIASFHITLPKNGAKHSNATAGDTGWDFDEATNEISWSTRDNLNRNFPDNREKCFTLDFLYADNGGQQNFGNLDLTTVNKASWDKVSGDSRDQFLFADNDNTVTFMMVPAPGTLAMCGAGMLAIGRRRR